MAIRDVGDVLGLGHASFNTGPAALIEFGLSPGLEGRATVHTYGGLEVHLPAREDLIYFKLYAAVDQGERSKISQISEASRRRPCSCSTPPGGPGTHDPSPAFLGELQRILSLLGMEVSDGEL